MLEKLTREMFAECLGSTFRVDYGAADPLEVELIEATDLRSGTVRSPALPPRRPFSLVFRGPRDIFLPQKTYPVVHEKLGAFDLFLVPIAPDPDGFRYEAIFN